MTVAVAFAWQACLLIPDLRAVLEDLHQLLAMGAGFQARGSEKVFGVLRSSVRSASRTS